MLYKLVNDTFYIWLGNDWFYGLQMGDWQSICPDILYFTLYMDYIFQPVLEKKIAWASLSLEYEEL